MAEGWARQLGGDWLQVHSAGIESHGMNLHAITVMHEAGVDISGQESTKLTDDMIASADYLVTVCGHADEQCPVPPPGTHKEHWPLNDPAKATGSEQKIMAVFRESRDDIRQRVTDLIKRLEQERAKE